MVHSFVLIKTHAGDIEPVLRSIRGLQGVETAHVIAGDHDVMVEVDGPDVESSMRTAATDLRGLDGVADTKTYVALE
jgi:DNA-binding Lrp family transcriptional regulator